MLRTLLAFFLLTPLPIFAYHVPTQPPSNLTLTVDYENGTVKADWDASDQMEDYPAERYAIGFGLSDEVSLPYGIATGNVGDSNALNTEYIFTASYLNAVFNETHGLFHVAVRSDNDTNSSYSTWTPTVSVTIQNKPSAVSIATYDMNRSDGIKFEWSASTSGFVTASTYKLYYKLSSASEWTLQGQQSNTDYVLAWSNLTANTYDFMVSACGSENDCNDSSTLSIDVVPTTTTTLDPVTVERNNNYAETGIYETDAERKAREQAEYEAEQERIRQEEEARRKEEERKAEEKRIAEELEAQRLYEEEQERLRLEEEARIKAEQEELARIEAEKEAAIQKELEQSILKDVDVEKLSDEELEEIQELIDVIQEIQEQDLEQYEIEEEVIVLDLPEIIIIEQEDLDEEKDTEPIKEVFEEDEFVDIIPDKQEEVGGRNNETPLEDLSDEEQEEVIKQVELKIQVVEITEDTTEKEIVEAVQALPVEEKIEVVKEVAKVSVQNLDKATEETKQIVQAVVVEVTKPETVAELSEEEKEVVAEVLGVQETNDVVIIAEQSVEDETIATAVQEYVERATENADVEDYGIQNVIVEVGIEEFISDPIGQLTDIDLSGVVLSDIGSDMPEAVKTQAAKTVVPVIIVGQIIATPITRRF